MRTFVAFELSEEVRTELSRLQGELKKAAPDVKWVEPKNIHLTLKFLGEVKDEKIGEIEKALDKISSEEKGFETSLFNLGAFPELNYPRVIWAGIDRGCAEAEKIAKSIEEELEKIGFPKEKRPFSAHLTLGRIKSPKNKTQLREKLLALEVRPESSAMRKITLFQSTLTPRGPVYTSLHEAKLMGQ